MPAPQSAPDWATDLYVAFESGASGQFILYGNVHDRLAVNGRLVNIERYIQDGLLSSFDVVFSYDLGNGLTVERGGERLAQWVPAAMRSLPHEPLGAIRFVSKYGRYLGNLTAIGRQDNVQVAVIIRGADQLLPADGNGYEHGSLLGTLYRPVAEVFQHGVLIYNEKTPRFDPGASIANASELRQDVRYADDDPGYYGEYASGKSLRARLTPKALMPR